MERSQTLILLLQNYHQVKVFFSQFTRLPASPTWWTLWTWSIPFPSLWWVTTSLRTSWLPQLNPSSLPQAQCNSGIAIPNVHLLMWLFKPTGLGRLALITDNSYSLLSKMELLRRRWLLLKLLWLLRCGSKIQWQTQLLLKYSLKILRMEVLLLFKWVSKQELIHQ